MRLSAIQEDNLVLVNGRPMAVDLSMYQWRAAQFSDKGRFVEYADHEEPAQVALFDELLGKWEAVRYTVDSQKIAVVVIPNSVSPRQIRQALTRAGLRSQVESAVAAGSQDLKDWWEFSTEYIRTNIHVTEMCQALGVTDKQRDDIWTLAASL